MRLFVLFFLVCFTVNSNAQDFIKINPIRSLLGEVHLFYERQLPNPRQALEYKLGIVYPFKGINSLSSVTNKYGYLEHFDGLNSGLVFGVGFRKYTNENKDFYYQAGLDLKLLRMNNIQKYITDHTGFYHTVHIDGNHIVLNPKFLIGHVTGDKIKKNIYLGLGGSFRRTKVTAFRECNYTPDYCEKIKNGTYTLFTNPNVGLSFHMGVLVSLYRFRVTLPVLMEEK